VLYFRMRPERNKPLRLSRILRTFKAADNQREATPLRVAKPIVDVSVAAAPAYAPPVTSS
jgi:hypothetical protein